MPIRTLFMGTAEFAVPILQGLIDSADVRVVGVVTQPDQPVGRGQNLEGAAVKQFYVSGLDGGNAKGVRLYQPQKLREDAEQILEETRPELIIVAAYGQMVPDEMLNYPMHGCLNIHGSLLPQLRGAVPVQMAILQGLAETGVTIQKMVKELDAGAVLAAKAEPIKAEDTTAGLMPRLSALGRDLLLETIPGWVAGQITPLAQDHNLATYCFQSDIAKEKAEILFQTPVAVAERMVRAFDPWPIAWLHYGEQDPKRVKVFKAKVAEVPEIPDSFGIYRVGKRLFLRLQDGVLELLELQLEGKQKRVASEYLFLGTKI